MNNYIFLVVCCYWYTLPLLCSLPHLSLEQLIREVGDFKLLNTKKSMQFSIVGSLIQVSRESEELGFLRLWWCIQKSENDWFKPSKIFKLTLLLSIYGTFILCFPRVASFVLGFLSGSDGKGSAQNAEDPGSIPGSGRSPREGHGNPHQYSCLENSMDRSLTSYSPRGFKELDTAKRLTHPPLYYLF